MKLSEQWFQQDGKLIQKQAHDFSQAVNQASDLKSAGIDGLGESKLVGIIPSGMVGQWAREAGIRGSDPEYAKKLREVVKRKMISGEFSKLRVWEGNY